MQETVSRTQIVHFGAKTSGSEFLLEMTISFIEISFLSSVIGEIKCWVATSESVRSNSCLKAVSSKMSRFRFLDGKLVESVSCEIVGKESD